MRLLIVFSIVLLSCGKEDGLKVQTEKIKIQTIVEKVEGLGTIKPEFEVKITSDVSGRILELNGKPGDQVKKGQVLVRIDEKIYRANLEKIESSRKSAEANLLKAQSELKRVEELFAKKLISQAEMDIATASYQVNKSQLEQADASLKEVRENLLKCTIVSPINGTIIKKNKELGEIAQGSGFTLDIIMIVANLESMETLVDINENDIVKVKLFQEVDLEIEAFQNKIFKGKVIEIANSAKVQGSGQDQSTNYEVKIKIVDKNDLFRPGMNVTAMIKTQVAENAITLPIQAVTARSGELLTLNKNSEETNKENTENENKDFKDVAQNYKEQNKLKEVVFIVNSDGKLEQRLLTKGISDANYYQVLDGINDGEEVVVGPFSLLSSKLKNGDKVIVDNKKLIKTNRN